MQENSHNDIAHSHFGKVDDTLGDLEVKQLHIRLIDVSGMVAGHSDGVSAGNIIAQHPVQYPRERERERERENSQGFKQDCQGHTFKEVQRCLS